jgi:hypothetical protein
LGESEKAPLGHGCDKISRLKNGRKPGGLAESSGGEGSSKNSPQVRVRQIAVSLVYLKNKHISI